MVAKLSSAHQRSYYIVAKLAIRMVMQSQLLIINEKLNSENNKGAPTFPAEDNHMLTVMNSQHFSNLLNQSR
jgi:hypothetical protein